LRHCATFCDMLIIYRKVLEPPGGRPFVGIIIPDDYDPLWI